MNKSYWFISAVKDENINVLYFVGANINGLFSWDLQKSEIILLDDMSDRVFSNQMYADGIMSNGKLYFPPRNTDKLAIYDIAEKKMIYEELYSEKMRKEINYRPELLLGHFVIKGSEREIFVICREYPVVVKIDTYTEKRSYLSVKDIGGEDFFLSRAFAKSDEKIFFPSSTQHLILVLDIKKDELSYISIDECQGMVFSSCLYHKGRLILLSSDSKNIVQYNLTTGSTEIFEIELEEQNLGNQRKLIEKNGCFLILPLYDNNVEGKLETAYKLNEHFEIIEKNKIFEKYSNKKKWNVFSEENTEWYFLYNATKKDFADMYWAEDVILISVNCETMECKEIEFPCVKGWSEKMMSDKIIALQSRLNFNINSVTLENSRVGLQQLLNDLLW